MERHRHGEDGLPVLDGDDPPGGEALAVADAVDLVDDRHLGVARQQKIGVQRMRRARRHVDGAAGRHQRLPHHLAAEHPLPGVLRRAAAKQIDLELLEIEDRQEVLHRGGHRLDCHRSHAARGRPAEPVNDTRAGLEVKRARCYDAVGGPRDGSGDGCGHGGSTEPASDDRIDVLIGGAGVAGLALAVALRQGLGEGFSRHGRRSGARPGAERSARLRHRGGGAAAVPGDRGLGRASPARRSRSSTWW